LHVEELDPLFVDWLRIRAYQIAAETRKDVSGGESGSPVRIHKAVALNRALSGFFGEAMLSPLYSARIRAKCAHYP
jgi:hypothetical protein